MTELRFIQVDAFADRPFTGNPAAVMPLDAWLPDETLQAIALENNLSETAFTDPGRAMARPITSCAGSRRRVEIALCGHATLASGHVLIGEQGRASASAPASAGMLEVARDGDGYAMSLPAWSAAPEAAAAIVAALGCTPVETLWHERRLRADRARRARRRSARLRPISARSPPKATSMTIVTAPGRRRPTSSAASSSPGAGVDEDPVTGSAHRGAGALLGRAARPRRRHDLLPGQQARRPSHRPARRRPRHPRRQMRHRDRRRDADLSSFRRCLRNCSPQIRPSGIPFSAVFGKELRRLPGGAADVEHLDRRGRTFVRPDAQTSGRVESALPRHRASPRTAPARSPRSPSGGPISRSSISSSPTARPASRSRSKLARARHPLPVHHRQGARFPDARSRARLPGEAVQRGRSGPRAQGGRGHLRGREGLRLRPSRPGNLRLYAEEAARAEVETTALLPTPDRSSARRTLRDRRRPRLAQRPAQLAAASGAAATSGPSTSGRSPPRHLPIATPCRWSAAQPAAQPTIGSSIAAVGHRS